MDKPISLLEISDFEQIENGHDYETLSKIAEETASQLSKKELSLAEAQFILNKALRILNNRKLATF